MSATYEINDGPTANEIWDHAKHSHNKNIVMPLKFRTTSGTAVDRNEPYYLEPKIIKVGSLDEDHGQMLELSGYTTYGEKGGRSRFTGFYNARSRSGTFFFG